MATVNKNFKVKDGLVVEGTTGTINGSDILTANAISGGSQNNITVTYNANSKTLDFAVSALNIDTNGPLTYFNEELDLSTGFGLEIDGSNQLAVSKNQLANALQGAGLKVDSGDPTRISVDYGNGLTIQANVLTVDFDVVADKGYVDALTTDDVAEGSTNLYYNDARARAALSGGNGISYSNGLISVYAGTLGGITVDNGSVEIDRNIVDTWYDANGAAANAQTAAQAYTDSRINDGVTSNVKTWSSTKISSEITSAVDGLVDGAPALLDTLNEIAAAINDDANYATTLTTALAGKQANLNAGMAISSADLANNIVSVAYASGLTRDGNGNLIVDENTIASVSYVDTNFVNVADLPGQLDDYIPLTQKAAVNGVATLDSTGNVPASQLDNVYTAIENNPQTLSPSGVVIGSGGYYGQTSGSSLLLGQKVWGTSTIATSASTSDTLSVIYGISNKITITARDSAGNIHAEEVLVVIDGSNNVNITEYAIVTTGSALFDIEITNVTKPWSSSPSLAENASAYLKIKRAGGAATGNEIIVTAGVESLWWQDNG